jgi:outer membrane protein OmpA-like peptidoglycan-associated protein
MFKKIALFLLGIFNFLFAQTQEISYNCFFKFNSAEYPSDSISKLQDWLKSNKVDETTFFNLVAYTDTNGSVDYNDQLSLKRLRNISDLLKAQSYPIKESKSIGERYAKDKYSKDAAYRKVEIKLISTEKKFDSEMVEYEPFDNKTALAETDSNKSQKTLLEEFEEIGNNKKINLNIEFMNNSNAYLDLKSEEQVFFLAEFLKNNPEKKVLILGHVCCMDNYEVSLSRARKVYEDLLNYKIDINRMKFQGMSNNYPLVEEIDLQTQQQNRRVEVVFYE